MNKIDQFFIEHPVLTDLLTIFIPFLAFVIIGILSNACASTTQIPVQTIEKIEYRDSLVYVHDTVNVLVPFEVIKEVVPAVDTSYLKTSVAESVAYLDTGKRQIHHTLAQNGHLQAILDTVIVVEYIDKVQTKEVPVEVEIIKYRRDALFWVLVGWAILCLVFAVLKIVV